MTDARLLELHLVGKTDAFRAVVERHQQWVFGYLVNQTGCAETSRDLFQEVFLRVARGASGFGGRARFSTWLFTIATNVLRDHRRRQLRDRVRESLGLGTPPANPGHAAGGVAGWGDSALDALPDPRPGPDREAESREQLARVRKALTELPMKQRRVLLLVNVEGMSLQTAADALGLNLNTVKTLLRRGRLGLARRLAEGECE